MADYNFREIEEKWQKHWEDDQTFATNENSGKPPYYILDMFPYPSGAGLHVGHPLGYIASDIIARYKRHQGFEVLHPMGYDAFGLPAEQYAIDTGNHPAKFTDENIARYRNQLKMIGLSYDWSREVKTSDPDYYKWTQWIFIQLFHSWYNKLTDKAEPIERLIAQFEREGNALVQAFAHETEIFTAEEWNSYSEEKQQTILLNYRLAYLADSEVNWCPALGTVLANEEVKDGVSERGGYPVERKKMRQWFLRITAYADKLLEGLNHIDWPEAVKEMQRNWIGKSVGAEVEFEVSGLGNPSPTLPQDPILTFPQGEGMAKSDSDEPRFYSSDAATWHNLKDNVRELRKNPTRAEELLWEELRRENLGTRFRRQHAIGKFIVDFVSLENELVIEVDGLIHEKQIREDAERTEGLETFGFKVIRFNNEEVINNIEDVKNKIKAELAKRQKERTNTKSTVEGPKVLPLGEDLGGVKKIKIFTTRPDTIFGATFMVLAPEHELVPYITTPEKMPEVQAYIEQAGRKSDRERMAETKKITGQFTGAYAINPFTKKQIPIWIADYVLADYGTGAIMAVPGHDSRDWAFAKQFDLPIIEVVQRPNSLSLGEGRGEVQEASYDAKTGKLVNSDFLNGLEVPQAIERAVEEIEKLGIGKKQVNYRLRDANFSRQRYWGEPFPIIYKNGIPYTVNESELPVRLPDVQSYKPTGSGDSPLAAVEDFVNTPEGKRETNTMPGWAGSSWYFLRYMDPHNKERFVGENKEKFWKQVDFYMGGSEHATGHLLYSRFWQNFLFDRGFVSENEPFKKLINQGMIQGRSSIVYRYKFNENVFVSRNKREQYHIENFKEKLYQDERYKIKDSDSEIDKYKKNSAINYAITAETISDKFTRLHVDVSLVENDILDIDKFKKWRSEYSDAEFILEDGKYVCGFEIEKMSKRWFNVVTPDDVIARYGCDAFRMYEMFLGPIEQSKPWNTEGIDGVSRFLRKLWNLYHSQNSEFYVSDEKADKDELKILHTAIKKIREDIERFSLNTCVSAFMIAVNELSSKKCIKREILEPFIILLSPFAPHVAEEIWSKLGHEESIAKVDFPVLNEEYLVESSFEYPLSINGKMRMKLELPLALTKEEVEKEVQNQDLSRWTEGKPLKKVIVVHGKIINVVV